MMFNIHPHHIHVHHIIQECIDGLELKVGLPRRHDHPDHGVLPLSTDRCLQHHHAHLAWTESYALEDHVEHVVGAKTSHTLSSLLVNVVHGGNPHLQSSILD